VNRELSTVNLFPPPVEGEAEGEGFEPPIPYGRRISSPLPYQLGLALRVQQTEYTTRFQYIKSYRPILLASQLFSKKTARSGQSSWQQRQLMQLS
jgi:hypothetical protein